MYFFLSSTFIYTHFEISTFLKFFVFFSEINMTIFLYHPQLHIDLHNNHFLCRIVTLRYNNITEILLKVALSTINLNPLQTTGRCLMSIQVTR